MSLGHQSVLLEEVCEALAFSGPDHVVVDLTLGGGGHLFELLKRNPQPKRAYGLDRDTYALAKAKERLKEFSFVEFIHARFDDWPKYVAEAPTRMVADLGVSSFQLDEAERGFSFRKLGPLDMRMDQSRGMTASEFLKSAREEEISDILWKYGEEKRSRVYARKIVHERKSRALETTQDFVELLGFSLESRDRQGQHPLTRVFQAIRIHVNQEFEALENLLKSLPERLAPGGRVAIISFHSLEDRIVKWTLRDRLSAINKKVIVASEEEQKSNPRSRSAKLRVYEKGPS